jgi:hypothetical protein
MSSRWLGSVSVDCGGRGACSARVVQTCAGRVRQLCKGRYRCVGVAPSVAFQDTLYWLCPPSGPCGCAASKAARVRRNTPRIRMARAGSATEFALMRSGWSWCARWSGTDRFSLGRTHMPMWFADESLVATPSIAACDFGARLEFRDARSARACSDQKTLRTQPTSRQREHREPESPSERAAETPGKALRGGRGYEAKGGTISFVISCSSWIRCSTLRGKRPPHRDLARGVIERADK